MKAIVVCAAVFALLTLVQSTPFDEGEHPSSELLVSELTGQGVLQVSSEEQMEQGPSRRVCVASQCYSVCRALGYTTGLCSTNAYCVCFR